MKVLIPVLLISSIAHSAPENIADLDFNNGNSIYTSVLNYVQEPREPSADQKGPSFVAKGKPFYSDNSKTPQVGWTVAPGTQYQIGIESSCGVVDGTNNCVRDNALSVEVYGDKNTKENGGVQDKSMFQLFDIDMTPSLFIAPYKSSDVHMLNLDMKFDRFYEVSKSATMHMQLFQPACGPAMSLQVDKWDRKGKANEAEIKLHFELMKNNLDSSINKPETFKFCEGLKVKRDEWNNLYVKMAPGYGLNKYGAELGRFFVYLNGKKVCEYSGNWGMVKTENGVCGEGHRIDVGTYGGRTIERRKVYFDNLRYGQSFDKTKFGKSRVKMYFQDSITRN